MVLTKIERNIVGTYRSIVATLAIAAIGGYVAQAMYVASDNNNFTFVFMAILVILLAGSLLAFFGRYAAARIVLIMGGVLSAPLGLIIAWMGNKLRRLEPAEQSAPARIAGWWVVGVFVAAVAVTFFAGAALHAILWDEGGGDMFIIVIVAVLLCLVTITALRSAMIDQIGAGRI